MILSKKEYAEKIDKMKDQMATILASGYGVELGNSRSGLKLFVVKRTHQLINTDKKENGG